DLHLQNSPSLLNVQEAGGLDRNATLKQARCLGDTLAWGNWMLTAGDFSGARWKVRETETDRGLPTGPVQLSSASKRQQEHQHKSRRCLRATRTRTKPRGD